MTRTLKHNLAIQMLTKASIAYTLLRKYIEFYDTYRKPFKDFHSVLDDLSNIRLIHWIIDLIALERYLRTLSYGLEKTLPYYPLVF